MYPESDFNIASGTKLLFLNNRPNYRLHKVIEITKQGFVLLKGIDLECNKYLVVDIYILDKQIDEGEVEVLKNANL